MRIMSDVCSSYLHQIPEIGMLLKLKAVKTSADSRLILTSLHRSKGLEFDQVKIGDDSEICAPAEDWRAKRVIDQPYPTQEVNLGYVGLTRGRKAVLPSSDMEQWMKDLPTHRNERKRSMKEAQPSQAPAQSEDESQKPGFGRLSVPRFA